jgi:exonuclease III
MGGDMNCVLNTQLDRRPTRTRKNNSGLISNDPGARNLKTLVSNHGLQDTFRTLHPTTRSYTCRNVSRICKGLGQGVDDSARVSPV